MLNPEITIGGSKVFASGSVLTADDLPIRVALFGAASPYFLEFRFVHDSGEMGIRNFNEGTGHIVEVRNINLEHQPISNITSLYVAVQAQRQLHLRLAIFNVGSSPIVRQLSYTIFDGGPVA